MICIRISKQISLLQIPPFNDSDWDGEPIGEYVKWKYGVPPTGNANFA
jgi:type I restriction enzyme M protein